MKKILLLLTLSFSLFAQTQGEIRHPKLDFADFNAFLSDQKLNARNVGFVNTFKVNPKYQYYFYAIANCGKVDAEYFDGLNQRQILKPGETLMASGNQDEYGLIEQDVPFVNVYSESATLWVVWSACTDCRSKYLTGTVKGK